MPVKAIRDGYHGDFKDTEDKFHGKQLLNIHWEKHLMFGWPMCVPLAPDTPFGALIEGVIPSIFGSHPEFSKIDWNAVTWTRTEGDGYVDFTPDPAKSIRENGLTHKAQIRFNTPGLHGLAGTGS